RNAFAPRCTRTCASRKHSRSTRSREPQAARRPQAKRRSHARPRGARRTRSPARAHAARGPRPTMARPRPEKATIPKTTYELDETGFRVARLKAYLGHNHSYAVLTVQRFNDVLASLKRTNSVLDDLRQIRSNRDLSTEGQRKRVYDVAHKFLSDVSRNSEGLRDQVVSATNWLPNVPAVADDASAADLDFELRGAFRELGESERAALLPQMMQGEHQELMRAILRAPRILSKLTEEQY